MKKLKEEFKPKISTEFQNQRERFRNTWGKALKSGKNWRKGFREHFEEARENINEKFKKHEREMRKHVRGFKNIFGGFARKFNLGNWKKMVTKRPPMTTYIAKKGMCIFICFLRKYLLFVVLSLIIL